MAALADIGVDAAHHSRVVHRADLAEIGQAAHRPQAPRLDAALGGDRRILGDQLQHREIDGLGRGAQDRVVARLLEAGDQRADVGEIELCVAPVNEVDRAEAMVLDGRDLGLGEGRRFVGAKAERAECPVALVAAGASRDLRHFGDGQAAVAASVEFLQPGERDVRHVHVEAHADGVGRDQIIDLAALEHRDLGIARGRRQGAHHHRRAAAEAAQHLRQRVDLLGRECDDCGARRKARKLGAAAVTQGRKARAADDFGVGKQLANDRLQAFEPRISVSSRPRAWSIRSVNTWPRSGSMPSCASSIAANAKSRPSPSRWTGIDSAVHRK